MNIYQMWTGSQRSINIRKMRCLDGILQHEKKMRKKYKHEHKMTKDEFRERLLHDIRSDSDVSVEQDR